MDFTFRGEISVPSLAFFSVTCFKNFDFQARLLSLLKFSDRVRLL